MAEDRSTKSGNEAAEMLGKVAGAAGKVVPGLGTLGAELPKMADTFLRLSNTGNAFNNDMIGMRVAAANARMSLDEYAKVVEDNRKAFTGLGGSVSQGTKVFGEFSKSFFESGLADNLRQMGYTSKDLNELLATQIGFQKSTTQQTVEDQMRTSKAAAELGTELDLIAKLTGVSRREQEEKLRKAAVDGQLENKFRLIGIQQGADAEKIARENYAAQYAKAEAMGQGQVFKEFFATGTATSKEAQMQLALFGEASMKTAESARELSYANTEASKSAMKAAEIANMQNQRNEALLTIGATGVGTAAAAINKSTEINDAAYQGMKKFMKSTEDVAEAMGRQREAILKEQKARDAATETIIQLNNRFQDLRAGIVSVIGESIQKSDTVKSINKGVMSIPGTAPRDASNEALAKAYIEAGAKRGSENIANSVSGVIKDSLKDLGAGTDKVLSTLINTGVKVIGEVPDYLKKINEQMARNTAAEKIPKRHSGTLGITGNVWEPEDILANIQKGETVMTEQNVRNMMTSAQNKGMENLLQGMVSKSSKDQPGKIPGIDVAKIANEIRQSISKVEITNWPKDMGKVEIKPPGAATKPAETKPTDTKPTPKPSEAKPEDKKDQAKPSEAQSKTEKAAKAAEEILIKSGDTLSGLAKKYGTTVEELMKANPAIRDANKILAGAKLTIPGKETAQPVEKRAEQASVRAADNAIDRKIEQKSNYTYNGKPIDANTEEGQKIIAQIEEAKKKVADFSAGLLGSVTTNFAEAEQASKEAMEEFKNMFPEMIPIKEVSAQQTEFKSKFTDEQRKFIEDYQGMSKDNQEFMTSALERSNSIDRESIAKHNGIVADLQKKKNERELTAEEEHQLSESEAIARNISEDVRRRQEQLDMINNIATLADEVELERLDQQARKELELMKATDEEKLDSTKAANDFIKEQFLMANDAILDSVGGMTDAALESRDAFMKEINEMFDMPSEIVADAQDSMMQELNTMFDMPSEIVADAQDSMMQELNTMFDMPSEVIANAQDAMMQELNTMFDMPSEVIANAQDAMMQELNTMFDMPSDVVADAQAKFMEEINALFDMPERDEFAEDEYGEGGEDIVLPEEPEEDYIGLALKEFTDQVQGLKEFEEDEYGEGGEAIGGEMDSAFAEDEDDYVAEALKGFQDLIPDSMIGDAEFAAGPGDASVAGMDYADGGPGDASVAGIDYATDDMAPPGANEMDGLAPALNELTKTLPQAKPPEKQGPASTAQFSKIDMGGFTLGPDGMPILKPKAQTQAMANNVKNEKDQDKKTDKGKQDAAKTGTDGKQDSTKEAQKEGEKKATKTLDDVVKALETLNTSVNKLSTKVEESSKNQVNATKSALSGNLFVK